MDNIKIGMFITERRKTKGLTQQDLADKLGVTVQAVSKWECGKCMPDVSILQSLCKILDISINDLLGGGLIPQSEKIPQAEKQIVSLLQERQNLVKRTLLGVLILISICLAVNAIIITAVHILMPSDAESWRIITLTIIVSVVATGWVELALLVERKMLSKLKKREE
ncbi:MAG: helix-turn-helix domain-containing protein [Firmicutes bacterium]|nr:helix-turn-helix domain-containing protein [Bacillota bacterium]